MPFLTALGAKQKRFTVQSTSPTILSFKVQSNGFCIFCLHSKIWLFIGFSILLRPHQVKYLWCNASNSPDGLASIAFGSRFSPEGVNCRTGVWFGLGWRRARGGGKMTNNLFFERKWQASRQRRMKKDLRLENQSKDEEENRDWKLTRSSENVEWKVHEVKRMQSVEWRTNSLMKM